MCILRLTRGLHSLEAPQARWCSSPAPRVESGKPPTQKNVQTSVLYRPSHRLFFDVGLQVTDIALDLPATSFVTTLVNWRSGYSFTTNMFLDALEQYRNDIRQFSSNIRFNLIHHPLSDFFIVYNEQQYTDGRVAAGRGVVVKYTHLFSF